MFAYVLVILDMDTNWIYGPILIIVLHIFALLIYAASKRIIAVKIN